MLKSKVPPCVISACLHTTLNGWTTARRFQQDAPCLVCGGVYSSDALEHYAFCPKLQDFGRKLLRLDFTNWEFKDFLLARKWDARTIKAALHIYCCYNTTNNLRYGHRVNAFWVYRQQWNNLQLRMRSNAGSQHSNTIIRARSGARVVYMR